MQQQQTNNNETDNNLQTREQRKIRSKTTRKKPFTSHMGTLLQLVSTSTSGAPPFFLVLNPGMIYIPDQPAANVDQMRRDGTKKDRELNTHNTTRNHSYAEVP
jgi:hypothetical protein